MPVPYPGADVRGRTPVGVTGNVAVAADGAVWVWAQQGLMRVPITVP
jgi:hypothetical protein